jgi:hypothetical protein
VAMAVNTIVVVCLVVIFLSGVLLIVSYASGWRVLASRFPARSGRPATGERCVSVSLGCEDSFGFGCTVLRGVFLGWSTRGLYAGHMLGVSIFFPPLEIPWSHVQLTDAAWGTHTILTVAGRRLGVPMKLVRSFRDHIEQSIGK